MSVIAFDGRFVCADRQGTECGSISEVTKLFVDGRQVLAITGSPGHGMQLVVWYKAGAPPDKYPVERDNDKRAFLHVFEHGMKVKTFETGPIPHMTENVPYATGHGGDLAMGAMCAGASARRAVEIANEWDAYCGRGVDVVDLLELADSCPVAVSDVESDRAAPSS